MNNENFPVTTPSLHDSITPLPVPESDHRGNGKIARLPKVLRDQVNRMLDDGLSYKAIIEKLEQSTDPPLPYKLLEINISRWKDNGYQRYLRHQEWRDQLRILRENGSDMSELTDGPKFQETLVQIALTEIFRVLQEGELKPDSLNYIRLFNALARLNREALSLRKYNDLLAKEQAELKQLDINRELAENEHIAIVDRMDRIMEMPRPRGTICASPPRGVPVSLGLNPGGPRDVPARSNVEQPEAPTSGIEQPASAPSQIKNRKSTIQNPSSPLPSRPCSAETPDPVHSRLAEVSPSPWGEGRGEGDRSNRQPDAQREKRHDQTPSEMASPIENPKSKIENCLDCGTTLPPVPPEARRRPEDHCPSCGMRLPDIGLCEKPGFDKCLNCGATQPHLLPNGERPRPNCHKCGERLHNPEPPTT
jgi:hypothetical protein